METVEVIPSWLMNSIVALVGIVFFMVWTIWSTMQNRKRVKNQQLVEIWRRKGTVDEDFYDVDIQEIVIKNSFNDKLTTYFIREDAVYHELYPKHTKFPWTQVTVQKSAFIEGNPEPIVKRGTKPVATASLIAGLREEAFTQFALQTSQHIKELNDALNKTIKPSTLYICLIVIGIAAILGGIFSFQTFNTINNLADSIAELVRGRGM